MPRPCASLMPKRIERNADARNVVYIVLLHRLRQHALVDQVLKGPQAGDVGLRFLDGAVGLLELLPHRGLAPAHADVVRPEPVHQLVHQDVREERVERHVRLIGGAPAPLSRSARGRCGTSPPARSSASPASCPSRASTRSSFGRLNAAVCTPRFASPAAKIALTTRIGASAPSFGFRSSGSIGRWFSISCSSRRRIARACRSRPRRAR